MSEAERSAVAGEIRDVQKQIEEAEATLRELEQNSRKYRTMLRQKDQIIRELQENRDMDHILEMETEKRQLQSAVDHQRQVVADMQSESQTIEKIIETIAAEILHYKTLDQVDGRAVIKRQSQTVAEQIAVCRAQQEALRVLDASRSKAVMRLGSRVSAATETLRRQRGEGAQSVSHLISLGAVAVTASRERQRTILSLLGAAASAPARPQSPGLTLRAQPTRGTFTRSRTPVRDQKGTKLYTTALPAVTQEQEEAGVVSAEAFDQLVKECERLQELIKTAESAVMARTDDIENLQGLMCMAETALALAQRREEAELEQFQMQETMHARNLQQRREQQQRELEEVESQIQSSRVLLASSRF